MNNETELYQAIQTNLKTIEDLHVYGANDRNKMDFPQAIFGLHNVSPKHNAKNMAVSDYMVQIDVYTQQGEQGRLYELVKDIRLEMYHLSLETIINVSHDTLYMQERNNSELLNRCTMTIHYKIVEGVF